MLNIILTLPHRTSLRQKRPLMLLDRPVVGVSRLIDRPFRRFRRDGQLIRPLDRLLDHLHQIPHMTPTHQAQQF